MRNYAPAFKHGLWAGVAYSGLSATVLKGREPYNAALLEVSASWTCLLYTSDAADE